jgi:hypothetical protein
MRKAADTIERLAQELERRLVEGVPCDTAFLVDLCNSLCVAASDLRWSLARTTEVPSEVHETRATTSRSVVTIADFRARRGGAR